MQHAQYRFKFYLNATHAIYLAGEMGQSHPHTWEVTLNTMKVTENFVLFDEVEKMCEAFFSRYKDVFINTVPPFTTVNPTLENLCHYFRDKLQEMLYEKGWLLLSIELSETPSRSYMISITDEMEMRKKASEEKHEAGLAHLVERMADKKIKAISEQKALHRSGMAESVSPQKEIPEEKAVPAVKESKAPNPPAVEAGKKKPVSPQKAKKKKCIWNFLTTTKKKPLKKGAKASKAQTAKPLKIEGNPVVKTESKALVGRAAQKKASFWGTKKKKKGKKH